MRLSVGEPQDDFGIHGAGSSSLLAAQLHGAPKQLAAEPLVLPSLSANVTENIYREKTAAL